MVPYSIPLVRFRAPSFACAAGLDYEAARSFIMMEHEMSTGM